jgi:hypothetical protein
MEELAKLFIGEWGWMFVVAVATLAFRDTLSKTWQGFMFLIGNDFNRDDIVWINGVKKARIVRQSLYRTTFYLFDHQRKFIVPNDRIWNLNIEKDLPTQKRQDNMQK